MRLKYVLNEVLVGLWRNVTMTVAMIITMAVSLTMLGASVLLYLQVDQMKSYYYGEIEVSIFLRSDVTQAQRTVLPEQPERLDLLIEVARLEVGATHRVVPDRGQRLVSVSPRVGDTDPCGLERDDGSE